MKKNRWTIISISLLLLLIILHLPFLSSDPDINLGYFRDTFNGEGLSVIQVRNFIKHGYLSVTECDKLLKLPLFNLALFLPFKIFGTALETARISLLISVLLLVSLFIWVSPVKKIGVTLACILLPQYFIFQFSHFVMADMIAIGMILLSIAFLSRSVTVKTKKSQSIFFATLLCALAYYIKILYLYSMLLVPSTLLIFLLIHDTNIRRHDLLLSLFWMLLFAAIYFFSWYLPNKPAYDFFLKPQLRDMMDHSAGIFTVISQNIRSSLLAPQQRIFIAISFITLLAGCHQLIKSRDPAYRSMFISGTVWILLESHKLIYAYLPTRYEISLLFSIGFLTSLVITDFLFSAGSSLPIRSAAAILFLILLLINGFNYYGLYTRREFNTEEMNDYLGKTMQDPERVVMGLWSPAITWESNSKSVPVSWYYRYMNQKNILHGYRPIAIVSEDDEADSGNTYSQQKIDLPAISDSLKHFTIGKWKMTLYWISPAAEN